MCFVTNFDYFVRSLSQSGTTRLGSGFNVGYQSVFENISWLKRFFGHKCNVLLLCGILKFGGGGGGGGASVAWILVESGQPQAPWVWFLCCEPNKEACRSLYHTEQAEVENVDTIDERRSDIVSDEWQSETLFLAIFDPRSCIVKSVFDCRLSAVLITNCHEEETCILVSLAKLLR